MSKILGKGNGRLDIFGWVASAIGRSLMPGDVTRRLDELFREHGRPACLRSYSGPELVAAAVQKWLKREAR